jgi:hypothetical protein
MLSGENFDLLLAYCNRKLTPEVAAALERHAEGCVSCRDVLKGQRLLWRSLDAWEAAAITPDFNRRLYQRIAGEGDSAWMRLVRPSDGAWRAMIAVASAAAVLLAAVQFRSPAPVAPPTAADVEIEQVERTLEDIEMLRELNQPPLDARTL